MSEDPIIPFREMLSRQRHLKHEGYTICGVKTKVNLQRLVDMYHRVRGSQQA